MEQRPLTFEDLEKLMVLDADIKKERTLGQFLMYLGVKITCSENDDGKSTVTLLQL